MSPAPGRAEEKEEIQLSDEQLVRDCLKGRDAAWSALIRRYKNLIFSIPIRYGFSQEDSADIFQAVCMDLLAELPRLRKPKALARWLIQVTRNKCFHRKLDGQRHPVQEMGSDDPLAAGQTADSLVAEFQQDQLLREALAELAPRGRHLVTCCSSRCQQVLDPKHELVQKPFRLTTLGRRIREILTGGLAASAGK